MQIIGVHVPGAFAEYIAIPDTCGWEIGERVSYDQAAFLEPMGVAMHGIQAADGVGGKNVVVLGCGPIGLMAIGIAKAYGASQVICSDIAQKKLAVAQTMGATAAVNSMEQDLSSIVLSKTGGRGADIVIDYSGNGGAISDGLKSLKKGGRMVLVGLPDKPVSLDLTDGVIYKEATLVGVTGRTMYGTWFECEKVLSSGMVDLSKVVGGRFAMKDFAKAFQAIYDRTPGKMLLIP
jgi:threonine 3-dehydrogenase